MALTQAVWCTDKMDTRGKQGKTKVNFNLLNYHRFNVTYRINTTLYLGNTRIPGLFPCPSPVDKQYLCTFSIPYSLK
jgi:hypothetical protein